MSDDSSNSTVDLASNLTVAWLNNPNTRATAEEATGFLANIHATLSSLATPSAPSAAAPARKPGRPPKAEAKAAEPAASEASSQAHEPAVSVKKSLASSDHIISLIDGKPYSTLKRHLGKHGLTPEQYRERYGLKADYPMVAPAYAEKRRAIAKSLGLGRKSTKTSASKAAPKAVPKAKKAPGRPRKAAKAK